MSSPVEFTVVIDGQSTEVSVPMEPSIDWRSIPEPLTVVTVEGPPGQPGPPGTNAPVAGEVPSGTANGSTTTFTLVNGFIANSTAVYINGLRQHRGVDYTESSPNIAFSTAPFAGDVIVVDYLVA